MDTTLMQRKGVGVDYTKYNKLQKEIEDFKPIIDDGNRRYKMINTVLNKRQGIEEQQEIRHPQTHTEVDTITPALLDKANADPYSIDYNELGYDELNDVLQFLSNEAEAYEDNMRDLAELNNKSQSSMSEQNINDKAEIEESLRLNAEWYKRAKDVLSRFTKQIKEEPPLPEIIEESQPEVLKKLQTKII